MQRYFLEIKFKNDNLRELYEQGKSKKYKLQKDIVKRFIMRINQLEAANDIYDLWQNKSLNFEKLEGNKNLYSIRVNEQYRIELEIEWLDENKTKGIINIVELSNHYK